MTEYIIVSKTAIEERIKELENAVQLCKPEQQLLKDLLMQELEIRTQILSQSTPLIPEIEKAFDEGSDPKATCITKQNYISNLKLDI